MAVSAQLPILLLFNIVDPVVKGFVVAERKADSCAEGVAIRESFCPMPWCVSNSWSSCQSRNAEFSHFSKSCGNYSCAVGEFAVCTQISTCCAGFALQPELRWISIVPRKSWVCQSCPSGKFGVDGKSCQDCLKCRAGQRMTACTATSGPGRCEDVPCPDNSSGVGVSSGCVCEAGYSGSISASTNSPFYSGLCSALPCPTNSHGLGVPLGCTCNPGFNGSIVAVRDPPFYEGSCSPVPCPDHSSRTDRGGDCLCEAGYSGRIHALPHPPFYDGACSPVSCPEYSQGRHIADGCDCVAGSHGSLAPIDRPPFYLGSCVPLPCPPHSSASNTTSGIVGGCVCDFDYHGFIAPSLSPPYYSGGCTAILTTRTAAALSVALGFSVAALLYFSVVLCLRPIVDREVTLWLICLGACAIGLTRLSAHSSTRSWIYILYDALGLSCYLALTALWSCTWRRIRAVRLSNTIFAIAVGTCVSMRLEIDGADWLIIVVHSVLWMTMCVALIMESIPLELHVQGKRYFMLAVGATTTLMVAYRMVCESSGNQNGVHLKPLFCIYATLVLVNVCTMSEEKRLPQSSSLDGVDGVRAMSALTALFSCGFAITAAVLSMDQVSLAAIVVATLMRSYVLVFEYLQVNEAAIQDLADPLIRPQFGHAFRSGDKTLQEKALELWGASPISRGQFSIVRAMRTFVFRIPDPVGWATFRWLWIDWGKATGTFRALMQLTFASSCLSIVSLFVARRHLPADRVAIGISAQDAANIGIIIASLLVFTSVSSLLRDQRLSAPIIDQQFRIVASLKPFLTVMKLVALYSPNSSQCTTKDLSSFARNCLKDGADGVGELVVVEQWGACAICCATMSRGGISEWRRWFIVATTLFSLAVVMKITLAKIYHPRVTESQLLKGMVENVHGMRKAYFALWFCSKFGLVALSIQGGFNLSTVLEVDVADPQSCEKYHRYVQTPGGMAVPNLKSFNKFFTIAVLLALQGTVTNEVARMFDAARIHKAFTAARSGEGARATVDLLVLPSSIACLWCLQPLMTTSTYGNTLLIGSIALVGVVLSLLALTASLGTRP